MNYTTAYTSPELLEAAVPLRIKLRQILLYHSAQEVYTTLREMLQEDYTFLQSLFAQPQPQPQPQAPPQPTVVQAVPLTQIPEVHPEVTTTTRVTNNTRIRVVKRETVEPVSQPLPPPVEEEEETVEAPKDQSVADRKAAIKRDNAEKTLKKYQELVSKGITPKSLLTKENIEKWVKDGLTYTQIARDHVGIDAEEIGAIARNFGIKSNIAMKRAAILASKK
jgi:hypothetical protein